MNIIKNNKGFTIIELMIAVAIIGILAAIAVPAYSNYTNRAKASEALTLADSAKTAVSEYYQSNGTPPTSNTQAGLAASITGTNTASVAVGAGGSIVAITTSLGAAGPVTFSMTPSSSTAGISWACTSGGSPYAPSSCR
jgi:type IV pilus assembly protein PilA